MAIKHCFISSDYRVLFWGGHLTNVQGSKTHCIAEHWQRIADRAEYLKRFPEHWTKKRSFQRLGISEEMRALKFIFVRKGTPFVQQKLKITDSIEVFRFREDDNFVELGAVGRHFEDTGSAFKGNSSDWSFFFSRCRAFNDVEALVELTQWMSLIGALIGPVPDEIHPPTQQSSFGENKKFTGFSDPRYGVGLSRVKNSLRDAADDRYRRGFEKAEKMAEYILDQSRPDRNISERYLHAFSKVAEACSTGFEGDYQNYISQACLKGCHEGSQDQQHKASKTPSAFTNDPTLESDIQDYLNRRNRAIQ